MLYLNYVKEPVISVVWNLTLTSVVFEYSWYRILIMVNLNLTLTSVVFEFGEILCNQTI